MHATFGRVGFVGLALLVGVAATQMAGCFSNGAPENNTTGRSALAESIVWTDIIDATATGATIRKTSGCDGCPAGGHSVKALTSGDGSFGFTVTEATVDRMGGWGKNDGSVWPDSIAFGVEVANGTVAIMESNVYRTDAPISAGASVRIDIKGGIVKYYVNNALLYTSSVTPAYPLVAKASLWVPNATINDAWMDVGASGTIDAGTDSGAADSGVTDGGITDSGVTDSGVTDSGTIDSGADSGGEGGVGGDLASRCATYPNPVIPAPLRTFYVNATSGNDNNNGTSPTTAWRTLDTANALAQAGDRIYLRGTFTNQWIHPDASGTATAKITFASEPGQTAVLSGGLYDSTVVLEGTHDIVVKDLELTGCGESVDVYSSHDVWLINLNIHDAGRILLNDADHNWISDSHLDYIGDVTVNEGDAISLQDGCDNNTVVRNFIGRSGHGAFDTIYQSSAELPSTGNVIALNTIRNRWAGGIILSGKSANNLAECNDVGESGQDGYQVGTTTGFQLVGSNNVIRFNVVHDTVGSGMDLQGYVYGGVRQDTIGNQIYHNTIYKSGPGTPATAMYEKDAIVKDNVIQNNVFVLTPGYVDSVPTGVQFTIDRYGSRGTQPFNVATMNGNVFRNNIVPGGTPFFTYAGPNGAGAAVYTPATVASTFGWQGDQQGDAMLANPAGGDFHLQAGSPAINAGAVIPGVPYNGSAPDMGALESP